jgi:hypothetical protein
VVNFARSGESHLFVRPDGSEADFVIEDGETTDAVVAGYLRACARSREVTAHAGSLDQRVPHPRAGAMDLRWLRAIRPSRGTSASAPAWAPDARASPEMGLGSPADTGAGSAGPHPRVVDGRWTMDAQGTMRLMFDTMDAYDRGDFDRLGEIYAEDARWTNFAMFRQRRSSGIRVVFDELRSTPTQLTLTARVADSDPVVSVFRFEGRRIAAVADHPSMEAAQSAMARGR